MFCLWWVLGNLSAGSPIRTRCINPQADNQHLAEVVMPRRTINNLTDRKIQSLVRAGKQTAVSDGDGLTLTISSSGYAAWVLRYRFGGKQFEVTIGALDHFGLAAARDQRTRRRKLLAEGINPARQKSADKAAQAAPADNADTFAELAWLWWEKTQVPRLENPQVVERVIRNHLNPVLGKMHLTDITPAHIIGCLESITAKGAPTVANDARRHLQKIFGYAVIRGDIAINPAAQITQGIAGHTEQARDRALVLPEIKKLLKAIERERHWFGRDNEITVHLLLLLGVRKSELLQATWSEVDFDRLLWTIPKARTTTRNKSGGKDFTIPLPGQAVELLRELEIRACGSEWVLPARRRGVRKLGHVSADTLNRVLIDLDGGLEHFTVHDLRRTMRSRLSEIGVDFAIAERCLNHKLPGQGEIYDRHDFLDARRIALQRWGDVLDVLTGDGVTAARSLIGGAQVIDLRAAG
jgi:integrase